MSKTITNKRPGPCRICGETVPAGAGIAIGTPTGNRVNTGRGWRHTYHWETQHTPRTWHGSPVSGRFVGGCPDKIDAHTGPENNNTES